MCWGHVGAVLVLFLESFKKRSPVLTIFSLLCRDNLFKKGFFFGETRTNPQVGLNFRVSKTAKFLLFISPCIGELQLELGRFDAWL